jgi:flavin reductase (DIM6/NTAB) family NADH-FMN oxidoreductase RutF
MSSDDRYFYEPAKGHGLPHDPLNAIVGPRPIGWIASRNAQGQRNLAPYSFFNCFNYRPPIIGFASSGWKDSVANIVETGEFVWNLTTRSLAVKMNESSASLAHGRDEFEFAGLTPTPGTLVAADRVAESPIDTWLVMGEVVAVHIARHLLNEDGIYQTALAEPVLRAGGPSAYYGVSEDLRFDLTRPDAR